MNHDELQQKLFEFVYDLLPEDEARDIAERITSDAAVARAYAEVKLHCDTLSEALRVPAEEIPLHRPAPAGSPAPAPAIAPKNPPSKRPVAKRSAGWGNWVAVAAASILACALSISLGGYGWMSYQAAQASSQPLVRMNVLTPQELKTRALGAITLQTTDLGDTPVSTAVEVALRKTEDNSVLFEESVHTDSTGKAVVEVPIPEEHDEVELYVRAANATEKEAIRSPVRFSRRAAVAHLQLDRLSYQPDDLLQARAVVLDAATADNVAETDVQFGFGSQRGGSVTESSTNGVATTSLAVSDSLAATEQLVVQSPSGMFPEAKREFQVLPRSERSLLMDLEFGRQQFQPGESVALDIKVADQQGVPLANVPVAIDTVVQGQVNGSLASLTNSEGLLKATLPLPAAPNMEVVAKVTSNELSGSLKATVPVPTNEVYVDFFPEGGYLIPELHNRVYFQLRDGHDEPVEANGRVVDSNGVSVTQFSTRGELGVGRGVFELVPQSGLTYGVELEQPAGVTAIAQLLPAGIDHFATLQTVESVLEPGEPLRMKVASKRGPRTMVLVATCRGIDVGHTLFEVYPNRQPIETTLELSPHAAGAIRVTLFDYGSAPYRAIAQRIVYRRPHERLQVALVDSSHSADGYRYKLQVHDAEGNPSSATLGALVVAGDAGDVLHLPGLPADYWLLHETSRSRWDNVNNYVLNSPLADQQLEFYLGVQPWQYGGDSVGGASLAETAEAEGVRDLAAIAPEIKPPLLLQNDASVSARAALAEQWRSGADRWIGVSGRIVLLLGVVTLFVALLLAGLQQARATLWGTTLGLATASMLIVGMMIGQEILQHADQTIAQTDIERAAEPAAAESQELARPRYMSPRNAASTESDFAQDEATLPLEHSLVPENAPAAPAGPELAESFDAPPPPAPLSAGGAEGFGVAPEASAALESLSMNVEQRSDENLGGLPPQRRSRAQAAGGPSAPATQDALILQQSAGLAAGIEVERLYSSAYSLVDGARRASTLSPVLLWQPLIEADDSGQATLNFQVPPETTTWFMIITAHHENGLGELRREFSSDGFPALAQNSFRRTSWSDRFEQPAAGFRHFYFYEHTRPKSLADADGAPAPGSEQGGFAPLPSRNTFDVADQLASPDPRYAPSQLPVLAKRAVVTPSEYPLEQVATGELTNEATVRAEFSTYQAGTPVQVSVRVYPSLASEIVDAARSAVSTRPLMRSSTFTALGRVQSWMNENRVADVDLMRGINAVLTQRDSRDWLAELRQDVESVSGVYRTAVAAYLAVVDGTAETGSLLAELASAQAEDGSVPCDHTFTGQGARAQAIEATALSVLAWSSDETYADNADRGLDWIRQQRSGEGSWATEEAQALSLMALCTDSSQAVLPSQDVSVRVVGPNLETVSSVRSDSPFPVFWQGPIDIGESNSLELKLQTEAAPSMPYVVHYQYAGSKPSAPEGVDLKVATSLSASSVKVGDRVQLTITVEGRAEPMLALRIPIPAGMQLENYPLPEHYGWKDGDLLLLFRSPFESPAEWVQGPEKLESSIPLIAVHAGSFTSPAARVYPVHAPEQAVWADPLQVEVSQE